MADAHPGAGGVAGEDLAPRVLERLEQTAALARVEQWPYEQFLEALLEAERSARRP
ncbi:MAG: hypothetical protein M3546_16790 [Actinomycetota bacterium]|nr:hypothetical protein [Actinomycetota bacterium]